MAAMQIKAFIFLGLGALRLNIESYLGKINEALNGAMGLKPAH